MKGCRSLLWEDCFICLKFSSVHNKCVICSVFEKKTNTFTQQAQVDCLPVCTPTVASDQQG